MRPTVSFDPGSFTDVYNPRSGLGLQLWEWLWRDENIVRMETACYLEKVAVEPLQPGLLADFDEKLIRNPRVKQLIGRMVKQILRARGYHWVGKDYKLKHRELFTTGSKYRS